MERRGTQRIHGHFPTMICNADPKATEAFHIITTLENLGAGGMYLRVARPIEQGTRLFIMIQLPNFPMTYRAYEPLVAMLGVVLRAEPQADGKYGMAVAFKHPVLDRLTDQ
ncbi:MAG TPA: hypothetical protein VD966_13455 [Pyrinomonadaceae bacterium]|nr:hypothetical protein [Pyrinomonadaceae bacterium]